MQDKLNKVLQIKIDAINKNIDNLNYLNEELEKNNENLIYIKDKISLFKNNELLNFDQISKDDFEKLLLMIDPQITDIFRDKACSYDGIIYIIEGIRKSISLQLTQSQTSAILSFVEGMKKKSINLQDVINNLIENKNRLPETDLDKLTLTLNDYEDIIAKYEDNQYLTEIDEIDDAMNFADTPLEEKVDMFEYLLKYNADIYTYKMEEEKEEIDENENTAFDLPIINYDSIDHMDLNSGVDSELENNDNFENDIDNNDFESDNLAKDETELSLDTDIENKLDDVQEGYQEHDESNNQEEDNLNIESEDDNNSLHDIKFNLDNVFTNNEKVEDATKEIELPPIDEPLPPIESVTFPSIDMLNTVETPVENNNFADLEPTTELNINEEKEPESVEIPSDNNVQYDEIESTEESHELNTVELEDIIKKIDARLKEMEPEETKEEVNFENNNLEIPSTFEQSKIDYTDLLTTFALPKMNIKNSNKDDVENVLTILNDNKVLDGLKNNKELLENILSNCTKERLEEIIKLINDNLLVKKNEFDYVLDIMLKTMPIVFTSNDVLDSFKLNLEFFKEKNLNIINLFDNYRELLIMNNKVLKENYNNAKQYGFEIDNENVKYYLYNKNLVKNIDSYIEAVGYEKGFLGRDDHFDGIDYIKKNPYKLNEINKDTLMKLRYSSENNMKIYGKPGILSGEISNPKVDILTLNDDYKNTYFNGEYSFIDRNEYLNIKKEIDDLKDYDLNIDENIHKLDEKYKNSELRYKFGNTLISRIKTIRLYNFLKTKGLSLKNNLLIALTYNTVLKIDEYNEIEKIVSTIVEGGK